MNLIDVLLGFHLPCTDIPKQDDLRHYNSQLKEPYSYDGLLIGDEPGNNRKNNILIFSYNNGLDYNGRIIEIESFFLVNY